MYDFQKLQTIRSFGDIIFNGRLIISESDKKQSNVENILKFNDKSRLRSKTDKEKKQCSWKCKSSLFLRRSRIYS